MIIYTAIYGPHDVLHEPAIDFPADVELVCFTDQPFESSRWDVRRGPASRSGSAESTEEIRVRSTSAIASAWTT